MTKSVFLKVCSAFMVGGQIAKIGDIVEVNETDAKDLLHRGKAILATAADVPGSEQNTEIPEQEAADAERPDDDEPTKPFGKGKKGK